MFDSVWLCASLVSVSVIKSILAVELSATLASLRAPDDAGITLITKDESTSSHAAAANGFIFISFFGGQ